MSAYGPGYRRVPSRSGLGGVSSSGYGRVSESSTDSKSGGGYGYGGYARQQGQANMAQNIHGTPGVSDPIPSSSTTSSLGRYPALDGHAPPPRRDANRVVRREGSSPSFASTAPGISTILSNGGVAKDSNRGGFEWESGSTGNGMPNRLGHKTLSSLESKAQAMSESAVSRRVGHTIPRPPASEIPSRRRAAAATTTSTGMSRAYTMKRDNSLGARMAAIELSSDSESETETRVEAGRRARSVTERESLYSGGGRKRASEPSSKLDDAEGRGDVSLWGGNIKGLGKRRANGGRGLVGLGNLGNTCFMNSIIQCLSNTVLLTGFFVSGEYEGEIDSRSKTSGLARDYAAVIKDLWSGSSGSVNPSSLKVQISKWASQFSGYQQHDSQELLRFLLDGLQQGLMRGKRQPPWPYDDDEFENRPVEEQSRRMWENYLARNDSAITDLFCGQLRSTVTCDKCRRESNCYDPFMDLSLPIPAGGGGKGSVLGRVRNVAGGGGGGSCSIDDCLAQFCEDEVLEGDDSYYCSKCKNHETAIKRIKIFRYPRILVLHLKRFNKRGFTKGKLSTDVKFPCTRLDLSPYTAKGSPDVGGAVFDLYAMTNHSGSLNGGHYIAHCLNYDSGQWYCFNDSHVSSVGSSPPQDSSAYLLFYVKRGS